MYNDQKLKTTIKSRSYLIEKKCLMILLLFHLFRFAYLQTVFFEQFNPKSRRITVIFNSVVTADLKKLFVNVMSYFQSSIRKLILSFQIRRSFLVDLGTNQLTL